MNKRIILNQIILAGSCLLITSNQALADRPSMDDRSEAFEPEIIDISTDVQEMPVLEEIPTQDMAAETDQEFRPAMEDITDSAEPQADIPPEADADAAEPVIHVYDHRSNTEITGDALELQTGETLPVAVLDFPRRGMTMEKVKNELGEPLEMSDAIGKPPITTWTYSDRVVYFEYSSVVHVVATH
ncbi:MAG: hypothetical protein OEM07_03915 [Gammaproteobacteria bacterium]|nr:hypothetical protein [Gammaproteobacteria bacterium]